MSGANYVLDKSFMIETTAISAFTVVKFGSADNLATAVTGVSDEMLGIVQESVATADLSKRAVDVRLMGISYVVVGATAVVRGNRLKTTATGTVIPVTTDADFVIGRAMNNGAIGDRVLMLLTPAAQRGTA